MHLLDQESSIFMYECKNMTTFLRICIRVSYAVTSKYMGWMGQLYAGRNVTGEQQLYSVLLWIIGYIHGYIKETNDARSVKLINENKDTTNKIHCPLKLFETKDLTLLTLGNGWQICVNWSLTLNYRSTIDCNN